MVTTGDIVAIVEAAYRVADDEGAWLRQVLDAAKPHCGGGLGVVGAVYDGAAADPRRILRAIVCDGFDHRLVAAMRSSFEGGTAEERSRSLEHGPILRLSRLDTSPLTESPRYGALARELGFEEVVAIRAGNPDGTGVILCAPLLERQARIGSWHGRWERLAAHVAAGMRLQRASRRLAGDADAVLSPGGRLVHASPRVEGAGDALRRAVVAVERARTRAGRSDADEALDAWTALVEGRWSLVDHFESDGKRFVLALENAPSSPDPRALSEDERPILQWIVMGHSNKLIAYELGLPLGTVATRVRSIARKLGARSRVDIAARYLLLRRASVAFVDVGGASVAVASADAAAATDAGQAALTPAEREVAALAAAGLSARAMAAKRRCSPYTVANLLQSAYRKLGVSSRVELAIQVLADARDDGWASSPSSAS